MKQAHSACLEEANLRLLHNFKHYHHKNHILEQRGDHHSETQYLRFPCYCCFAMCFCHVLLPFYILFLIRLQTKKRNMCSPYPCLDYLKIVACTAHTVVHVYGSNRTDYALATAGDFVEIPVSRMMTPLSILIIFSNSA